MSNYQHYLDKAKTTAAGVASMKAKVPDAIISASLLSIAYAVMAVAKAIAGIRIPAPQRQSYHSLYRTRVGRRDVTINVNFRGMNRKKMEEAAEVVLDALRGTEER